MKNTTKSSKTHSNTSRLDEPSKVCYDRKCENCDVWVVLTGLQEVSEIAGECVLNPPVLVYDEDGDPLFLFPTTLAKGFCGQFRPRLASDEAEKI